MRFLMFILLVFSGTSIWLTLNKTPAFNPKLVTDTVIGDGRTVETAAMYDPATYAFQRGYGFLIADALVSPDSPERDEAEFAERAENNARRAVEAFEIALSQDPGNAHAWAALAWGRARLGDDTGAVKALRVSWQIAPNNRALADTRLNLAGLLTDPELGIIVVTQVDRAAMARDLDVLALFDRRALAVHMEISPHLSALSQDLDTE